MKIRVCLKYFAHSCSKNINAIDNKIELNKSQYDLKEQIAKILALSSGNVSKHWFLTGKAVFPEKELLEKASTIKRFENSPLGSELKKQTDIAEKQYKKLDNTYEFDRIKKEKPTIKKYNRSNLIYNSKCSFYEYYNIKHFNSVSLTLKHSNLLSFYNK